MRRAAIYARISADRTGLRAGVERQETECRELAERNGWEVTGVYCDNDVSAFNGKPRPDYQRLLADLEAGSIDAIVAWHPDRLYRRARDLVRFVDVVSAAKARVATVQSGDVDLNTADGRMIARIVGAVSEREGEHKGERHRSKDRQMAEQGRPHGGPRTYGYRYQGGSLVTVPEEAAIVRELISRILAGESLHELERDLTARAIPTARGSTRWHHASIRRLLRSPALAGLRVHLGEVRPGDWEPIITIEQHRALDALLSDPGRLAARAPRRYLLTGIARCGLCGSGLMARPKMERRRNYLCRECGKIGVLADPLEELVVNEIFRHVDDPIFWAGFRAGFGGQSSGEAEAVEAQLRELAELWAAKQITQTEWLAAREPLRRQLEAQRRQEVRRARATALEGYDGARLRAEWPQLPLAQRRQIINFLFEKVTVGPALRGRNRFDSDRVSVKWRI